MAYSVVSKKSGKTYYLHHRVQPRKIAGETTLYFFGGEVKDGALDDLPEGFKAIENERTGLPMLKKK